MRHAILAALAVIAVMGAVAGRACAAILDDYLGGGYVVLVQTSIFGAFSGCRQGMSLDFADGTHFICGKTIAQTTNDPRVYILAKLGAPASAVLIGSQPYAGSLDQLGGRVLLRPLLIGIGVPPPGMPAYSDSRILKVLPVQSINTLQAEAAKRLNDAQGDPLPLHAPVPHK